MKKIYLIVVLQLVLSNVKSQHLAFPSAEGFGRFASGGRVGTVYHVTNLNNTGTGSFRDAVSMPNRTVVFDVGGVIRITTRIIVSRNITIAGQTAPGGGICIYGNGLSFSNANNAIVRHIRIRMGINGDSGKDAIAIASGNNMIFDHVSVSWGRDGTIDINPDSGAEIRDLTIQNCIVSQGLETHSTGGLMQTTGGITALRNLYIDNNTRNPKVKGINQFINNIIYNWNVGAYILGDSDGPSAANVTNNYFINGPNTSSAAFTRGNLNFQIFASNNFQDSNKDGVLNGTALQQADYGTVAWKTSPFAYPTVTQMSPAAAYNYVVTHVGASLHRDEVDTRLITELTSLGKIGELITNENNAPMNGPGTIAGGSAPADTDLDGMPNSWESSHGFNPNSADSNGDADGDGYTNLEEYLNDLVGEGSTTTSSITIQENTTGFCSVNGTVDNNNTGFTGTGFSNATNAIGSGINWSVSAATGSCTIGWRYANGSSTDRPAKLLVNGRSVISSISFPSTTNWTTWSTVSVNVTLSSGTNTIRLESTAATGLANIDQISISGINNPQAMNCSPGARSDIAVESESDDLKNGETHSEGFHVFPNPSDNSFVLKVKGSFRYLVYDQFGKEIETGAAIDEAVLGGALKSSVYILKVDSETSHRQFRLIKK